MKKKVISHINRPTKVPLFEGLIFWLLLQHFEAPSFVHGVFWALWAVWTLGAVYNITQEQPTDIFKDNK